MMAFLFVLFFSISTITMCGCSNNIGVLDTKERNIFLMQKAHTMENEGDITSAIKIYKEVLNKKPGTARAHLNIALLLHAHRRDYVNAIYHYQRYLELRPDTEKKDMVKNRIRLASQMFAAKVLRPNHFPSGTDSGGLNIKKLEKENFVLKDKLERLESEVNTLKSKLKERKEGLVNNLNNTIFSSQKDSNQDMIRSYRVKRGDTLSSIADEIYQDAGKWEKIYKANIDSLKESDTLKIGQILIIPL